MANSEKVTVERSYFEALLRRADFHFSTQQQNRPNPANVSISRVEYDSLLRTAREYELLRSTLLQGGVTEETLDTLLSNVENTDLRKDSGISVGLWNQDSNPTQSGHVPHANATAPHRELSRRNGAPPATFNFAPGNAPYQNGNLQPPQSHLRIPSLQRQTSYGMSSMPDETVWDEDLDFVDDSNHVNLDSTGLPNNSERRTLYLSGFSERTTYKDLLSVIKGGKLLSVNLRPERSATVTFLDGAAEFLAWAKRNDIYLNSKRIEVKWATRQFNLNAHISAKIATGATRNILIGSAMEKGLTETRIRADMEHIHNLVVISVTFNKAGDAFVETNSIHNALFARTCMMSRREYKGCRISFLRDGCDVPLPTRNFTPRTFTTEPAVKKKPTVANRFDILNIDGTDASSDEENRTPSDNDNESEDETTNVGVSLNFLDTDST